MATDSLTTDSLTTNPFASIQPRSENTQNTLFTTLLREKEDARKQAQQKVDYTLKMFLDRLDSIKDPREYEATYDQFLVRHPLVEDWMNRSSIKGGAKTVRELYHPRVRRMTQEQGTSNLQAEQSQKLAFQTASQEETEATKQRLKREYNIPYAVPPNLAVGVPTRDQISFGTSPIVQFRTAATRKELPSGAVEMEEDEWKAGRAAQIEQAEWQEVPILNEETGTFGKAPRWSVKSNPGLREINEQESTHFQKAQLDLDIGFPRLREPFIAVEDLGNFEEDIATRKSKMQKALDDALSNETAAGRTGNYPALRDKVLADYEAPRLPIRMKEKVIANTVSRGFEMFTEALLTEEKIKKLKDKKKKVQITKEEGYMLSTLETKWKDLVTSPYFPTKQVVELAMKRLSTEARGNPFYDEAGNLQEQRFSPYYYTLLPYFNAYWDKLPLEKATLTPETNKKPDKEEKETLSFWEHIVGYDQKKKKLKQQREEEDAGRNE